MTFKHNYHPSPFAEGLSISSLHLSQREKSLLGAEPRFELGHVLQQADALPTELCRIPMSYAAPSELRRTQELRRTH